MLKEFEEVFYFDTSVIFRNDPNETIKVCKIYRSNNTERGRRAFEVARTSNSSRRFGFEFLIRNSVRDLKEETSL